jgi:peroxiredoxin Q/BCP
MLTTNDIAPDFSLPDQDGGTVSLADLLAHGPAIVFFYPADFTPICTKEACIFRDGYAELAAAGISVVGVSPNDSDSHARFRDRHKLNYTLLADPEKQLIKAFGVDGPLGIGIRRSTFLIGPDRHILAAVRADLRLGPHKKLMQTALAAAKKGSEPISAEKGL